MAKMLKYTESKPTKAKKSAVEIKSKNAAKAGARMAKAGSMPKTSKTKPSVGPDTIRSSQAAKDAKAAAAAAQKAWEKWTSTNRTAPSWQRTEAKVKIQKKFGVKLG